MTRGLAITSAGAPSAIFAPASITKTRSEIPMIAFITCSMIITLTPLARIAAHEVHRALDLDEIEAGHHFIEQQNVGLHRQRLRQFEPLAIGDRQFVGGAVPHASEADEFEHLVRLRRGRAHARAIALAEERANRDILADGHVLERLDDLPGASNPHLADAIGARLGAAHRRRARRRRRAPDCA